MNSTVSGDEPYQWDVSLTRVLVGERYGAKQLDLLRPVLRAAVVRLRHCEIHYDELKAVTAKHLDGPLKNGVEPWQIMLANEDETGANNMFVITCEAHLFACIQALHATADNLAHVLYYGLGWNLENKPNKRSAALNTVHDRLYQLRNSQQNLKPFLQHLVTLRTAPEFKLLESASNHIKHHGGLHTELNWEPSPDRPYELVLSEFERDAVVYPQKEAVTFIQEAHLVISKAVVHTGCALNDWLRLAP